MPASALRPIAASNSRRSESAETSPLSTNAKTLQDPQKANPSLRTFTKSAVRPHRGQCLLK